MITGARKTGLLGEIYASRYLRFNGYTVLSANYLSKTGEIDLIASKGGVICFVEVKTRADNAYFAPAEAVDSKKEENIKSTASAYISRYKINLRVRYDIIEIILLSDGEYKLKHMKNAF